MTVRVSQAALTIGATFVSAIAFTGAASWASTHQQPTILAFSLGALGGLIHEIVQSRGRLLLIRVSEDGVYIGSIAGMLLGGVAGIMVARGLLVSGAASGSSVLSNIAFESFSAGLALKGVLEAAGTKVPEAPTPTVGQASDKLRLNLPATPPSSLPSPARLIARLPSTPPAVGSRRGP
jgi:hypothetical protein